MIKNKYSDLFTKYNIKDNECVDLDTLKKIIVEEVGFALSYEEIVNFVTECSITLTESEIKGFLEKKRVLENPELIKIKKHNKIPRNLSEITDEEINAEAEVFGMEMLNGRYLFDAYSLK